MFFNCVEEKADSQPSETQFRHIVLFCICFLGSFAGGGCVHAQ